PSHASPLHSLIVLVPPSPSSAPPHPPSFPTRRSSDLQMRGELRVGEEFLAKYNRPGPRYTSYPTAPIWNDAFGPADLERVHEEAERVRTPVSLYMHIPFCESLCLFCACNVVIQKNKSVAPPYLEVLKHDTKRLSMGIQDFQTEVQQAVHRIQPYEMTRDLLFAARELGFDSINVDLIYGLPYQTADTFAHTVDQIIGLAPDRIALFSYAHVPWL